MTGSAVSTAVPIILPPEDSAPREPALADLIDAYQADPLSSFHPHHRWEAYAGFCACDR